MTRVFSAPLEYKFQQGQRLYSPLPQSDSRTHPASKEILWDRVTQHKHNLSHANVNPFTTKLFKH